MKRFLNPDALPRPNMPDPGNPESQDLSGSIMIAEVEVQTLGRPESGLVSEAHGEDPVDGEVDGVSETLESDDPITEES